MQVIYIYLYYICGAEKKTTTTTTWISSYRYQQLKSFPCTFIYFILFHFILFLLFFLYYFFVCCNIYILIYSDYTASDSIRIIEANTQTHTQIYSYTYLFKLFCSVQLAERWRGGSFSRFYICLNMGPAVQMICAHRNGLKTLFGKRRRHAQKVHYSGKEWRKEKHCRWTATMKSKTKTMNNMARAMVRAESRPKRSLFNCFGTNHQPKPTQSVSSMPHALSSSSYRVLYTFVCLVDSCGHRWMYFFLPILLSFVYEFYFLFIFVILPFFAISGCSLFGFIFHFCT